MMKSEKIQQQIDKVGGEINTLSERKTEVQDSLNALMDSVASDEAENGAQSEVRGLQTDATALSEAIERKEQDKIELESDLEDAIAKETDKAEFQEFCERAEKALELRKAYFEKAEEINSLLEKEMPKLAELKENWKNHVTESLNFAESIAKGMKRASREHAFRTGNEETLRSDELIQRAEDADLDMDGLTDPHPWRKQQFTNQRMESDFPELNYRKIILEALRTKITYDLNQT